MDLLSVGSLMLSIAFVWSKYTYAWAYPFVLFVITALISGWITPIAIVPTVLLAVVAYYYYTASSKPHRIISVIALTLFSIAFATHNLPGFNTIILYEDVFISGRKGTSSLKFYADKPLVGLILLLGFREYLSTTFRDATEGLRRTIIPMILGIIAIYAIGYAIGFVRFDITISVLLVPWFIRNLMFTVIAEELLLRGVIQNEIEAAFGAHKYAAWYALLIASGIFGLVHLYGGVGLAVLATLAGILYGYVYIRSRKIETAIVAHIVLNAGTASLFYYPGTQ